MYAIRPSAIHGYGVFATRPIKKGRRIGEYKGKRLPRKQVIGTGRDCTYLMSTRNGQVFIDGSNLGENPMGYINHPPAHLTANAIVRELNNGRVFVYAKRNIEPDEEILFDYQFDPAKKSCSLDPNVY